MEIRLPDVAEARKEDRRHHEEQHGQREHDALLAPETVSACHRPSSQSLRHET